MNAQPKSPQARREFLAQLGVATAMLAGSAGAAPLAAQHGDLLEPHNPTSPDTDWDTSWIDHLANVPYRVVFDASNISDGFASTSRARSSITITKYTARQTARRAQSSLCGSSAPH